MNEINTNGMQMPPPEEVEVEIASAGRRIGAYLLNCLFSILAYLPFIGSIFLAVSDGYVARAGGTENLENLAVENINWMWMLGGLLVLLVYVVIQAWYMSRDGQSLGKKILNIRLLKTDGSNPGFWGAVLLREVAFNIMLTIGALIAGYLLALLFGSGGEIADVIANTISLIVWLVCFVMLFNRSKDRRTLQDYLADTVVVRLPKR
ncbi:MULTISPECIES: RDD family protein [unclassified Neisseria]|uniref:RDD family protein n=1 Tax=unclassified Neisseria TaxID=2623750 RepID=UPI002666B540|nr:MULTISPECIES: RDD family protein [unclassified Neisseria]MDO1509740.1 RDD family protein [Neisseria sp. MVDL19-042950]MDO1515936.1 RDD family protein [Neisseria sp. MVDL18-041461]MDO1563049.1 RDD family protein [Neisseria sp. MVDL20-010259]